MCATVQVEIIRCPALEPLPGTRVEAWFLAGVSSGLKEMINFLATSQSGGALICGAQHRSACPAGFVGNLRQVSHRLQGTAAARSAW
jgi:hypothetical protein